MTAPRDTFLLYHPSTRRTGRQVAEALGIPHGSRLRDARPSVIVRWGSQRQVRQYGARVINKRAALALASDKYRTLRALHEAGVGIPEFTLSRYDALEWSRAGFTVLGRTRHGRAGNGIHVYQPGEAPGLHEMFTRLVPASNEYRVHVFDGEVIRCQQKQLTEGVAPGVIRSHESGYVFVGLQSFRLHQRRYDAAVEAVDALGLDFGAVDLLIGEDGDTYVLEVNTAPGCSPMTLTAYATALRGALSLPEWV